MPTQYINATAIRKALKEKGRRCSPAALSWFDHLIQDRIDAVVRLHNGGKKTIDSALLGHVQQ